ncbi:hypothetical protein DF051_33580 [Burkholderia contaminans]|uniref:Uncharacterized protein n=1 Tax=Burkholderia contaminans TaxID=488447 RepID=A0A3N8P4G4_9BURK|nr:hypothetical protein DF051_33580 [Burkholderia contaminans]
MPRHHCGLQKNVSHVHLRGIEPEYALKRCSGSICSWLPGVRSAGLEQPASYRQTKTPRCLPGCL